MNGWVITLLLIAGSGAAAGLVPPPALAYVGPGAGVSLFGAAFGLIAAVVSAIGFVLFWPIRSLLKKRRTAKQAKSSGDTPGATAGSDENPARDHGPAT
jgi:hypothetical protein